eukprot:jgi/Undpi1/11741/HiC_scaffold_37.g14036.m1
MILDSLRSATAVALFASCASAQVTNLRITEVDVSGLVEVTNLGPAFTTAAPLPFCHRLDYSSVIPAGTTFSLGARQIFLVLGLNQADSDLWLYSDFNFPDPASMIHGVKWGPNAGVGRTAEAVTAGLWPSLTTFVPAPAPGAVQTVNFDGFGNAATDWYLDGTSSIGIPDPVNFATVPSGFVLPEGTETFESIPLADTPVALVGWNVVDTGTVFGDFELRIVDDIGGARGVGPTPASTQWLRIRDQDAAGVQNRWYGNFLDTQGPAQPYTVEFYVQPLELPAASAATKPRFTIQHGTNTGVTNTWGIELDQSGARLVVLSSGGPPVSVGLGGAGIGAWTRYRLDVDFAAGTITATSPSITTVQAIAPAANVNPSRLRFCYRGEGVGNVATMLLDDIRIAVGPVASETVRLGSPPNPNLLLPGQTSGPALGAVWDPIITPFVPNPLLDFLVITARTNANVQVPFASGTVLIDLGDPNLIYTFVPAGQAFSVSIPNNLVFLGTQLSTQGLSASPTLRQLTNALDIVVGR